MFMKINAAGDHSGTAGCVTTLCVCLFVALTVLVGASIEHGRNAVKEEICAVVTVELIDVDPPPNMRVDLLNVETHELYKSMFVSKFFNDYEKLKLGTIFDVPIRTRVHNNGMVSKSVDNNVLYKILEDAIRKQ